MLNLWGADYWPGMSPAKCIEFTSLINKGGAL